MTKWGAEIRKGAGPWWRDDEDRPGWLVLDEQSCEPHWRDYGWYKKSSRVDCVADWPSVDKIRLPADHPAYLAIAHNMRPWSGGERAPADWSECGLVLLYDRSTKKAGVDCITTRFVRAQPDIWQPDPPVGFMKAIGYTPTTAPTVPDALVERMVRLVREIASGPTWSYYSQAANDIIAELEPPTLAQRLATKHGIPVETVEAILSERKE